MKSFLKLGFLIIMRKYVKTDLKKLRVRIAKLLQLPNLDINRKYLIFYAGIYMFQVSNGNTRTVCKICTKLTIKTLERRYSDVFIVNCEQILYIVLLFPLLTLDGKNSCSLRFY